MKNGKKWIMAAALFGMLFLAGGNTAYGKTKTITLDLTGDACAARCPAALEKARRIKVKSSNSTIVKARYKTDRSYRYVEMKGRKKGTATVTVKCTLKKGGTKIIKYKVKVIKSKKANPKDEAEKAFKIQNRYRTDKGREPLEWSDELYKFCLYRLKKSGFDYHKNIGRDTVAYFGNYAKCNKTMFAENLYFGHCDAGSAMKAWKRSTKHYQNLLSYDHVCGAIASYEGMWCAIFYGGDKSEIENFRDYRLKEITVKRFDSISGDYVKDCSIGYYEADDRWGSQQVADISQKSGKTVYLEIGKTYVIYERKAPDGCEKAERIKLTVTENGESGIVLRS